MEHWINLNMSTANTLYFFYTCSSFIAYVSYYFTVYIIFSLFAKMKDNIDFFILSRSDTQFRICLIFCCENTIDRSFYEGRYFKVVL